MYEPSGCHAGSRGSSSSSALTITKYFASAVISSLATQHRTGLQIGSRVAVFKWDHSTGDSSKKEVSRYKRRSCKQEKHEPAILGARVLHAPHQVLCITIIA